MFRRFSLMDVSSVLVDRKVHGIGSLVAGVVPAADRKHINGLQAGSGDLGSGNCRHELVSGR